MSDLMAALLRLFFHFNGTTTTSSATHSTAVELQLCVSVEPFMQYVSIFESSWVKENDN